MTIIFIIILFLILLPIVVKYFYKSICNNLFGSSNIDIKSTSFNYTDDTHEIKDTHKR